MFEPHEWLICMPFPVSFLECEESFVVIGVLSEYFSNKSGRNGIEVVVECSSTMFVILANVLKRTISCMFCGDGIPVRQIPEWKLTLLPHIQRDHSSNP